MGGPILHLLLLFIAGLFAGFVNAMAGAGSLLTLPALIFTGLGATAANATNRIAVLFTGLSAMTAYRRGGLRVGRLVLWLLLPTIVGAVGGAFVASLLDNGGTRIAIAIAMVVFLSLSLVPRRKPTGEPDAPSGPPAFHWAMVPAFVAIGFYGGFLQAGVGILILLYLSFVHRTDLVAANAVKVAVVAALTVPALGVFALRGVHIDLVRGLVLASATSNRQHHRCPHDPPRREPPGPHRHGGGGPRELREARLGHLRGVSPGARTGQTGQRGRIPLFAASHDAHRHAASGGASRGGPDGGMRGGHKLRGGPACLFRVGERGAPWLARRPAHLGRDRPCPLPGAGRRRPAHGLYLGRRRREGPRPAPGRSGAGGDRGAAQDARLDVHVPPRRPRAGAWPGSRRPRVPGAERRGRGARPVVARAPSRRGQALARPRGRHVHRPLRGRVPGGPSRCAASAEHGRRPDARRGRAGSPPARRSPSTIDRGAAWSRPCRPSTRP